MRRLLGGVLLVAATMFCGEVAVLAAARVNYHDPFAPYRAIMPEQPAAAVNAYPCHLQVSVSNGAEPSSCRFEARDGIFDQVTVVYSNRQVIRTVFTGHPDSLLLGDLVLCWGQPIYTWSVVSGQTPTLEMYWKNQFHARVALRQSGGKKDYLLLVTSLSIEHVWRAIDRDEIVCAPGR